MDVGLKRMCPECEETDLQSIMWGSPIEPPPDDVLVAGCARPERAPEWHCRSCGYQWLAADVLRPREIGYDLRYMLRDNWPHQRHYGIQYDFGSEHFRVSLTRDEYGYFNADALYFPDVSDGEILDEDNFHRTALAARVPLKYMCVAAELFIKATLSAEGRDPNGWG